jgi:hypothetical protein
VCAGTPPAEAGLQEPSYYRYRLAGVLIHSGTADAGHYYSYVKRRKYDTRPGPNQGQEGFFSFDDTRVEPYELFSSLEADCFGARSELCLGGPAPCKIRRLPLDCHCSSGVNSQC